MAPRMLARYEIRAQIARTSMSTVYEGWDSIIDRKVAIKTLSIGQGNDIDSLEIVARFKKEAKAAGKLNHPHIVSIFDCGESDGSAYIVMEFVEGKSLKALLDARRPLVLRDAVRIMSEVLSGLHYSHQKGVVHRDIKPSNIVLSANGTAKITDFGIARLENSTATQVGAILGTPAYMSPEQLVGDPVDARTDIYSAGVLLYQMLTGVPPFEGGFATITHKVLNTRPIQPSKVSVQSPPALDGIVAKAMARNPQQRFASAEHFAREMQAAADATMVNLRPKATGAASPPARPPRRAAPVGGNAMILGAASVALCAAIMVGWYVIPHGKGLAANAPPGGIAILKNVDAGNGRHQPPAGQQEPQPPAAPDKVPGYATDGKSPQVIPVAQDKAAPPAPQAPAPQVPAPPAPRSGAQADAASLPSPAASDQPDAHRSNFSWKPEDAWTPGDVAPAPDGSRSPAAHAGNRQRPRSNVPASTQRRRAANPRDDSENQSDAKGRGDSSGNPAAAEGRTNGTARSEPNGSKTGIAPGPRNFGNLDTDGNGSGKFVEQKDQAGRPAPDDANSRKAGPDAGAAAVVQDIDSQKAAGTQDHGASPAPSRPPERFIGSYGLDSSGNRVFIPNQSFIPDK